MRILFLTHYFPPEVNAPATRTFEHCLKWSNAGHDVTVITCQPNCPTGMVYPGYRNSFRKTVEQAGDIRVIRVWTYIAANARRIRRITNFLTFFCTALIAALREGRPDVVVATSPQFFCGWAGVWAARLLRVPFVLEIRDIWPESIKTVGAIRSGVILRCLAWLERRMYLAADRIVAVGEGYRRRILATAPVGDRVSVVANGVDLGQYQPRKPDAAFLAKYNLTGKFVCSYVGTIGMAHGLDVVVRAARMLKDQGDDRIRFCLVGDGADCKRLMRLAESEGVAERIVFTGTLEKQHVPGVIASSGACLVHLRAKELFESVIPSKIFEAMALERPIIMGVRGESLKIVEAANAGISMVPESAESLVAAVTQLADNPEHQQRLGRFARGFVRDHYDRNVLADRMLQILEEVVPTADSLPDVSSPANQEASDPSLPVVPSVAGEMVGAGL